MTSRSLPELLETIWSFVIGVICLLLSDFARAQLSLGKRGVAHLPHLCFLLQSFLISSRVHSFESSLKNVQYIAHLCFQIVSSYTELSRTSEAALAFPTLLPE